MTPLHYRELCRVFVSRELRVHYAYVQTLKMINPLRKGRTRYRHRVDLYWVTEDAVARYVHVAHTRWRKAAPLGLASVLHLQQVRQKLAAHQAALFTNTSFSRRAQAAAKDEGIALFLVRPAFDYRKLKARNPRLALYEMQQLVPRSRLLYTYEPARKTHRLRKS